MTLYPTPWMDLDEPMSAEDFYREKWCKSGLQFEDTESVRWLIGDCNDFLSMSSKDRTDRHVVRIRFLCNPDDLTGIDDLAKAIWTRVGKVVPKAKTAPEEDPLEGKEAPTIQFV